MVKNFQVQSSLFDIDVAHLVERFPVCPSAFIVKFTEKVEHLVMAPSRLLSSKDATFLAVFTATQSMIGFIANAIVLLYFLLTRRSAKSTADKLILNLTMADFIAVSTYVPWRSYILIERAVTNLSEVYTSLFVMCIFSTGNAILLIGLDRFVAVVWPLKYKMIITCKLFWASIITAWLLAILLGVGHGFSYTLKIHTEYELFLCALSFLQLILLATIYVILLRKARIQSRNISRRHQSVTAKKDFSLSKTVRTTFIIVCLFYATFVPYAVYRVVSTVDQRLSDDEKRETWRWLTAFTFLNSCLDPMVYFFAMKRYRANFRQRFLQNRNRDSNSEAKFSLTRTKKNLDVDE